MQAGNGNEWLALTTFIVAMGLGAVVAWRRHRWQAARWMARIAVASSFGYWALAALLFGQVANADASSKATALAKSISNMMNCGVFAAPAVLIALGVWVSASRRLKATSDEEGRRP